MQMSRRQAGHWSGVCGERKGGGGGWGVITGLCNTGKFLTVMIWADAVTTPPAHWHLAIQILPAADKLAATDLLCASQGLLWISIWAHLINLLLW